MEVGRGYWVELRATPVPPTPERPHGIDYSLCLLGPEGFRLVCYDNAHPVTIGSGPGKRRMKTGDHRHVRTTVRPYVYKDAETLMQDFWTDVGRVLKEEGVP
jgi:hypothetical protein